MRTAIVTDIHGNGAAFAAVLEDLREVAPDFVLFGGDLADGGSSPAEIVDQIRGLRWSGVAGNGEEALSQPATLERFAAGSKAPASLWAAVREMMAWTRAQLGPERTAWLGALPRTQVREDFALVHATAESTWQAPGAEATDAEFVAAYAPLGRPLVAYGHIHRPFVRAGLSGGLGTVANAGSVGLPYDGDARASYLLLDDHRAPVVRRVEYDIEQEARALSASGLPHSNWVARMLRSAGPEAP